ncbi:probable transcription factor PosF21 [Arabidopsis lyrata subsp. lyrata]|uniref:probable transcription factor PosF21 n=1 Tax=Arabidopsis lyrata subsp. lyrata TaxID=81972 RepID=UPI000A29B695|nr:probable transcription factor PosF21 [Arabidopsis lyrata subsp. lyrata]|eukprot:XP_020887778.1 probable transcription factor PosF21 [Arabidopsis lyrata subsp. lyrata]
MNGSNNITPSGPRLMTQPSPALSLPPLSRPSSSSFRRNSLPSMILSPSAHVESRDSSIRDKKNPSLPPLDGNVSSSSLVDGDKNASGLEFGSSDYTDDELNMIAESTKLKKIASDPVKVRRILANRVSMVLSKQRQSQYVIDLEQKIKFLENENASMSEKITLLENDKTMMMNEKKEITIKIESLEQQVQLRDGCYSGNCMNFVYDITHKQHLLKNLFPTAGKTSEVLHNRRESDRSNMKAMDPNIFNRLQPNPDFYGQN